MVPRNSQIWDASCWANTDCATPTRMNIYVFVPFGFIVSRFEKKSSVAAADVVAAATAAAAPPPPPPVEHTRPGSASLC